MRTSQTKTEGHSALQTSGQCNNPEHENLRNELAELKREFEFKELQFGENFELAKRRFNEAKDSAMNQRDKANAFG